MSHHAHSITMFFIMILSGLLSTMNVWADRWEDIRLSLNDIYMILLMTGWMFLFMGLIDRELMTFSFGVILTLSMLWCIRTQFGISESQYLMGMIPHHSMAIQMSKRLLEKENTIPSFLQQIIDTQAEEIQWMKKELQH